VPGPSRALRCSSGVGVGDQQHEERSERHRRGAACAAGLCVQGAFALAAAAVRQRINQGAASETAQCNPAGVCPRRAAGPHLCTARSVYAPSRPRRASVAPITHPPQVHSQKGGKIYLPIGVDRVEPWLLDGLNVQPLLSCILSGQPLDLTAFYAAEKVGSHPRQQQHPCFAQLRWLAPPTEASPGRRCALEASSAGSRGRAAGAWRRLPAGPPPTPPHPTPCCRPSRATREAARESAMASSPPTCRPCALGSAASCSARQAAAAARARQPPRGTRRCRQAGAAAPPPSPRPLGATAAAAALPGRALPPAPGLRRRGQAAGCRCGCCQQRLRQRRPQACSVCPQAPSWGTARSQLLLARADATSVGVSHASGTHSSGAGAAAQGAG
jgi:hypothetical protein